MVKLKKKLMEDRIGVFVILSILLHILILLFLPQMRFMDTTSHRTPSNIPKNPELEFKIVETPIESVEKPLDAQHVSDKNSLAQQEELRQDLQEGNPYASKTLMEESMPEKREVKDKSEISKSNTAMAFWKMLQENKAKTNKANKPETVEELNSSAYRQGGFALNTYAWDYAPYMLKLRDKIQDNLRPPMSFTRMGIGAGQNIIKFKIDRTGKLLSIKLMDSSAHGTLDETSLRAINYSFPFIDLPKDFPEEFLEITAYFSYIKD